MASTSNPGNPGREVTGRKLDEMFDAGEDVLDYFDTEHVVVEHHPPLEKRVTFTMPAWMVSALDEEASELAISRNAVVNTWIAERLRRAHRRASSSNQE